MGERLDCESTWPHRRTYCTVTDTYRNIEHLLVERDPDTPVYCIYPHIYEQSTRHFVDGFSGRTLYAVKANNHPQIVALLHRFGVTHFDCASLSEIQLVAEQAPGSTSYFMNPARLPGHARDAQRNYGVRHFVIDHMNGLAPLLDEITVDNAVIFARMAVSHESAMADLSCKFGAKPENIPAILTAIRDAGAEPALAFNVGTGVTDPEAYAHSMDIARRALEQIDFQVRLLDIGGGFPRAYPGFEVPPLDDFFSRTAQARSDVPLADNGELLCEPGRALSAPGLSAVSKVLLKKTDRLYLNDGMYGAFWELRFKGHLRYACRAYRDGKPLLGETRPWRLFGPTCDSSDEMPGAVELPVDIEIGDHLEFGSIGAYSLSGRTTFNGFYSDEIVTFSDPNAAPPD